MRAFITAKTDDFDVNFTARKIINIAGKLKMQNFRFFNFPARKIINIAGKYFSLQENRKNVHKN